MTVGVLCRWRSSYFDTWNGEKTNDELDVDIAPSTVDYLIFILEALLPSIFIHKPEHPQDVLGLAVLCMSSLFTFEDNRQPRILRPGLVDCRRVSFKIRNIPSVLDRNLEFLMERNAVPEVAGSGL